MKTKKEPQPRLNAGVFSSDRLDWPTPSAVLERVYAFDEVALDPCSGPLSIVKARATVEPPADGLSVSWQKGLVYVNPPYGKEIVKWVRKCAEEAAKGCEIIALVPSRTDTVWWHRYLMTASAICLWKGRVKFLGAPTCAPFPSAIAYWGTRALRFERAFGEVGRVLSL